MYMLDSKWPSIQKVTGIDLSTFKLAVCEEKKSMMVRVCVQVLVRVSVSVYVCSDLMNSLISPLFPS